MVCSSSQECACFGVTSTASSSGRVPHPLGKMFGEAFRGEILVLDIDAALGAIDHVEEQGFDLADLALVVEGGTGAGDADVDVGQVRRDALAATGRRSDAPAARARRRRAPSARAQAPPARRGFAVDHRLHVMERRIGHAGEIDAARIVEAMRARVPAPGGEIEPAGERERVVDHDDLLVLRGAERQVVVEAETDLPRRAPTHGRGRKQLALVRIEDRIVPHQNVNEELAAAALRSR